jgi:hypothetical protein
MLGVPMSTPLARQSGYLKRYLSKVLLPKWEFLMLLIAPTMILVCLAIEAHEADAARFARGPHLLHMTFDEKDPRWNFNHNVTVRSKADQLTLIVLDVKKDREADTADLKRVQGGLGNPLGNDAANSSERRSGHMPFIVAKQKLNGTIDKEGDIRFGVTTIHDGKLVSLHFVGRSSLGGASGKVYLLSSTEPVREGNWYLKNSFSRGGAFPGFNGTSPFGP